ncbi:MAG: hypothetical protein HY519_02035 [Candidatus Aenigmarchaeota archaeon]|nr:hypothetical protein [Candidatus Aenigmarchaeota archaeon]
MAKFQHVLLVALILAISGCTQQYAAPPGSSVPAADQPGQPETEVTPEPPAETATPPAAAASEATIEYTDAGFVPAEVTVTKGGKVTWKNTILRTVWPASAKHPTHEVYPNSSITKCKTAAESTIFDACKGIKVNETYSFVFNEVGAWFYHDHLNSKLFGKVTVVG